MSQFLMAVCRIHVQRLVLSKKKTNKQSCRWVVAQEIVWPESHVPPL